MHTPFTKVTWSNGVSHTGKVYLSSHILSKLSKDAFVTAYCDSDDLGHDVLVSSLQFA